MPSQPFSSCGQGIDLKPFHAPSTFRCDPPRKLVLVHPQHEASVSGPRLRTSREVPPYATWVYQEVTRRNA